MQPVVLRVCDTSSACATSNTVVNITNVAPTSSLTNNGPVTEGSPVAINFGPQFDPSPVDIGAGLHFAFDCAGGSLAGATYGASGTNLSTTCYFNAAGSYTVSGRVFDKDNGSNFYTTSVQVNLPTTPAFTIDYQGPPGCICTPRFMNTQSQGAEHLFFKARDASVTLTVYAHSVNLNDPENLFAEVYDTTTDAPVATLSASYGVGTAPGAEISDTKTFATVADRVYRTRITTPGTPPTQPHWRAKIDGASEAAINSPSFASIEPDAPVRWFFNVAASESLGVRIFSQDVPLPVGPGTETISFHFANPATMTPGPIQTVSAPVPPGVDQVVNPTAAVTGKVPFVIASNAFTPNPPGGGAHYRLQSQGLADSAIYMTPFTAGQGNISGTVVTSGGGPFPDPVTVELRMSDPSHSLITSVATSGGAFSFPPLFVGGYRVQVVAPTGSTVVGPSFFDVFVECDGTVALQFTLNRPPVANAGPDQTVGESTVVTLDGNGSSDPDLNPLSFAWIQTGGPAVALTSANTATPSFTAPQVPAEIISLTLTFHLTVDDGFGDTSTDTVVITVQDIPPAQFQAARTTGYWKNHQSQIAAMLTQGPIDLGDRVVTTVSEAVSVLSNASAQDARNSLRAQLLATILNLRNGSDPMATGPDIRPTAVFPAKAFLASHPSPVTGRHPDRAAGLALKDALDAYNNSGE